MIIGISLNLTVLPDVSGVGSDSAKTSLVSLLMSLGMRSSPTPFSIATMGVGNTSM